ncbi:MAG: glycosyltransferase family 39 protein [Bacteroidales bacterium]|nr:glycosyltransferase family 39 protein [Bacteroidales bacterium]
MSPYRSDRTVRTHYIWALIALTLVSLAMRLAALPGSPLTYDELSVVRRLDYANLLELFRSTATDDGHPAGVQIFMYLWCRMAGTSSVAMRLPFAVAGALCIPLMYDVARSWYGRRAALLSAALMVASQTVVYYSCIARPYGAGLPAVLLALAAWSRVVWRGQQRWWLYAVMAIGWALCLYIHYYCALTAALMGLAGLVILLPRGGKPLLRYVLAAVAAIALFVPHLPITMRQLTELGGLSWLSEPTPGWLLQYGRYLCNYSWWVPAAVMAAVLLGCDLSRANLGRNAWRMATAALLWLLPIAIGYAYSKLVSPTLQYSCMLFSLPYLPLVFCGFMGDTPRRPYAMPAVAAVLVAMSLTLIVNRQHYKVTRLSYLQHSVEALNEAMQRNNGQVLSLIGLKQPQLDYYGCTAGTLWNGDDIAPQSILRIADSSSAPVAVASMLTSQQLQVLRKRYPYLLNVKECTSTDVLTLSREPRYDTLPWHLTVDAAGTIQGWSPSTEWLTLFEAPLSIMLDERFANIEAEVELLATGAGTAPKLVMELIDRGRTVDWRECSLADLAMPASDSTLLLMTSQQCHLCVKSRHAIGRYTVRVSLLGPCPDNACQPLRYRVSHYPSDRYAYALDEEL